MTTAQEIIERLFADQTIPEPCIPSIVMVVLECDSLKNATVEELEVVRDQLVAALHSHNLATEAARAARFVS